MIYSSFILYVVKIFFLFQQLVFSVLPIIKIQTIYLSIDRSRYQVLEIPILTCMYLVFLLDIQEQMKVFF